MLDAGRVIAFRLRQPFASFSSSRRQHIEKTEELDGRATVKNIIWGPEYQHRSFCFSGTCPEKRWTWCVDLRGGDGRSYTVLSAFKDMYYEEFRSTQVSFGILNDPRNTEQDKRNVRSSITSRREASTGTAQDYIFWLAEAEYQSDERRWAVEKALIKQFSVGIPVVVTYVQSSRLSEGHWIFDTTSQKKECRARVFPPVQEKRSAPEEETASPGDGEVLPGMNKRNPKSRYIMEGLTAASMFRAMMSEVFANRGRWPENNAAAGLLPPEDYKTTGVESITAGADGSNGIITIRYSDKVDPVRNVLLLTAKGRDDGVFDWQCVSPPGNGVEESLLPQDCR